MIMLDVTGICPGESVRGTRRVFLKVGALGLSGLTLTDHLRSRAAAAAGPRKDTAVIQVSLLGGPSHIDTFDMKPEAPLEFRGEFRPIGTNITGIRICEHLPRLARQMDKLAIVRSVAHSQSAHGMATHAVMTGHAPPVETTDNLNPSCGSYAAKLRGPNRPRVPAYVCVPDPPFSAGAAYLGVACNPFRAGGDPASPEYRVRNLTPAPRVDLARLRDRRALLHDLDTIRRDVDVQGVASGYDQFYTDAFEIVTSAACREAFDLEREDPRLRDRYGRDTWGQSALLARRLVEAGVTFVTLNTGFNWDTHGDNFPTLKNINLPMLDRALGTLVQDLFERGLHERVLVVVYGEFGRTPRVNATAGRDHWPGAMSVVFSGGGLKMGQVIGATDPKGEAPKLRPLRPQDVLATVYHVLGIDQHRVFQDAGQRPVPILNEGQAITELI
jgi:hypothetical protein